MYVDSTFVCNLELPHLAKETSLFATENNRKERSTAHMNNTVPIQQWFDVVSTVKDLIPLYPQLWP